MKPKYFILIFLLVSIVLVYIFTTKPEKKMLARNRRNVTHELFSFKEKKGSADAFEILKSDTSFFILSNTPSRISYNMDVNNFDFVGTTYFFDIKKDTFFFLNKNRTTFNKIIGTDTSKIELQENSGYITYNNGFVYYLKKTSPRLFIYRENIYSRRIDSIYDLNSFISKNFKDIDKTVYSQVATGRFYSLNEKVTAFLPNGISKVFLFSDLKTESFTPLNSKDYISWKSIETKILGGATITTFQPSDGDNETLNLGIFQYNKSYIIIPNESTVRKGEYYYNVDFYDIETLKYQKTLSIKTTREDFLYSFAVSQNILATLNSKGLINYYTLQ
jgi:hypothetical protein